jgi:hypothetical protein
MGAGSSTSYQNRPVYTMPSLGSQKADCTSVLASSKPIKQSKTSKPSKPSRPIKNDEKNVSVRNFDVIKWYPPPDDATIYEFRSPSNNIIPWIIASDHIDFVGKITDTPTRRFFKGMGFKVFCAIKSEGGKKYVFKIHKSITPTIANVFLSVKNTALGAIALKLQGERGGEPVSYKDTMVDLNSVTISSMLVRTKGAKHIYVDMTF